MWDTGGRESAKGRGSTKNSLKHGPQWHCFLVLIPLQSHPVDLWLVSSKENTGKMMGCHFQDRVLKRLWLLSWELLLVLSDSSSGGIKLPCHEKVLWRGLCGRGPRPVNNHMSELGSRAFGFLHPWSSPGQQLDYNFMRNFEPEAPR